MTQVAVKARQASLPGDDSAILAELLHGCGYAIIALVVAIIVFNRERRVDK